MLKITKIARKVSTTHDLLVYEGTVKGETVKVLVDSGANGYFVSSRLLKRLGHHLHLKTIPDSVKLADGRCVESTHVTRLPFTIGNYSDLETFHVLDLEEFDLVFGKPWLAHVNPSIDWRRCTLRFQHNGKHVHLIPIHDQETRQLVDTLILSSTQLKHAIAQKDQLFLVSVVVGDTIYYSDSVSDIKRPIFSMVSKQGPVDNVSLGQGEGPGFDPVGRQVGQTLNSRC